MRRLATLLFLTTLTLSCGSSESPESQPAQCSGGTAIERGDGRFCHYASELIIEGFECPPAVPHRNDLGDEIICSSSGDVSGAELADLVRDELGRTCCADACNECAAVAISTTDSLTADIVGTWFAPPDRIIDVRDDGTWSRRCTKPNDCLESCDEEEGTWEVQDGELVLVGVSGTSSHEILELSESTLLVSGYDDLRPWVRVQCTQLSPNRDANPATECDDGADSGLECTQNFPGSTCISYDELPGESFSVCGQGRPKLMVNVSQIDLGTVPVEVDATPHQFGASNVGLGPLEGSVSTAAPFSAEGEFSLPPKTGISHVGAVTFQSSEPGSFEETLLITSNGGDQTVELKAVAE